MLLENSSFEAGLPSKEYTSIFGGEREDHLSEGLSRVPSLFLILFLLLLHGA